ncbi:dialkylresorcinol condensing enzyme [Pseudomonas sp. B11D7D]|nr:dialkylrecorsinol condensing enzyme [Pseudomonas sp. B11D7D]QNH06184.1 dialkylresorcinol condensing enzyme [Pseudomonas sp. B11D7D]
MRHVLVVHFSQTGQLDRLAQSVCAPLRECDGIEVDFLALQPAEPFPFPWPFLGFFRIFPETVLMKPQPLLPLAVDADKRYDLVILAYQVWFLSPSLPCTSFLASPEAARLLKGTPVVTLIGCRNMWLMAQEKVKTRLHALGAKLVDNVVLTDACGTAASFLATPLWMFTGRQKPYSWVPRAGIDERELAAASRFGDAMARRLLADQQPIDTPMLAGLGAVKVDEKLIASEKVGNRSFTLWSRLLSALGPQQSRRRGAGLVLYIVFLICLILTVVPITALLKKLLAPLFKARIQREKAYFAGPSGE